MRRRAPEAVVIGGSAGAVDALLAILPALPPDLAIPVIVVVHVTHGPAGLLPDTFRSRVSLATREPFDKESGSGGVIWFAPPGYHVLIEADRTFALSAEAPVRMARPSIDVLFASAADAYGPAVAGIVLSGANPDGAEGLRAIAAAGGTTLVQAPAPAAVPAMPLAAIAAGRPDRVGSPRRIGAWIAAAGRRAGRTA